MTFSSPGGFSNYSCKDLFIFRRISLFLSCLHFSPFAGTGSGVCGGRQHQIRFTRSLSKECETDSLQMWITRLHRHRYPMRWIDLQYGISTTLRVSIFDQSASFCDGIKSPINAFCVNSNANLINVGGMFKLNYGHGVLKCVNW